MAKTDKEYATGSKQGHTMASLKRSSGGRSMAGSKMTTPGTTKKTKKKK